MTHKICIFNDRKMPMRLTVQHHDGESDYMAIQEQTSKLVELRLYGEIPFFKVWETGQAFLSGIDEGFFESKRESA
jgi:hypothetical protein